jgi:hypothetical protein
MHFKEKCIETLFMEENMDQYNYNQETLLYYRRILEEYSRTSIKVLDKGVLEGIVAMGNAMNLARVEPREFASLIFMVEYWNK